MFEWAERYVKDRGSEVGDEVVEGNMSSHPARPGHIEELLIDRKSI